MTKVLLIVRWPVGGIRTFLNYVYSKWPADSIEFHFLAPDNAELAVLKNQLSNLNCTWHTVKSENLNFKDFAKAAFRVVRSNRFDLIHAHGFTSALSVGWMLPFISSASMFTSHDVLNAEQFRGIKGKIKRVVIPLLLNRFSVIHSVSHDAEDNLKRNFRSIDSSKCRVILNGVNTYGFYNADPAQLRSKVGVAENVKLVGFFGRFMSQKGFKYLIEAMEHLEADSPGGFHVVCFGSGEFIREEQAEIKRRNLSHLFHFHEFVADTGPYMKGCDMVVMPSLWEACGLVAMEVLSAGVTLVASSCIGLKEVCESTPAIMVEPASGKSLAQGMRKAMETPKTVAAEYAIVAKDRFNIDVTRKEIVAVYKSLADK